jgi:glutathione S-transferase
MAATTHNYKLLLGYWAVPLRAESAKYILELAGYPYEEKLYTSATAGDWFGKDKQSLGLDFPNLPYLINGATKLTES